MENFRLLSAFCKKQGINLYKILKKRVDGNTQYNKWYQFFDATLNWERTSEGYFYWYKQQLYLTFFALICEYNTSEQQNIELYLQNLLKRFQTPKEAQKIRKEFYKQFIKYKENHILTFINESKL